MVSFRLTRVADGYLHCPLAKSVNLGNNRQACVTYPFFSGYNPVDGNGRLQPGRFADVNWAEGGNTVRARALTTFGSAAIAGPLTAFVGARSQRNLCANGGCGTGVVNNVMAAAESGSVSQSATNVEIGASCANSPGACGTAPPAHVAPSGNTTATDPKSGGGG
jgi:hypothetical protein